MAMVVGSYLILHGIENDRPPEHWQFQLAAELVRGGHRVRYPGLPVPHAPVLDGWLDALCAELAALGDARRIVVCHSLACLLWFHAAGRGLTRRMPVDRVLLVSPPDSARVPQAGASFRLDGFDAEAVRASAQYEVAIACSDADPYNPIGAQTLTATCSASKPPWLKAVDTSRPTPASAAGRSPSNGAALPSTSKRLQNARRFDTRP